MTFRDLEAGDVFVLRWWLDTGPTPRHYLVVRKDGDKLKVLRLEEESNRVVDLDASTFDACLMNRDVMLVHVYKATTLLNPVIG